MKDKHSEVKKWLGRIKKKIKVESEILKQEGINNWVYNTPDHEENIYLNTFIYS